MKSEEKALLLLMTIAFIGCIFGLFAFSKIAQLEALVSARLGSLEAAANETNHKIDFLYVTIPFPGATYYRLLEDDPWEKNLNSLK